MVVALRSVWFGFFLAITLVIAGVQFASHSVQSAPNDTDIAFYLELGGSLDDLCLANEETHNHSECPFCRELDAFVLEEHASCPSHVARFVVVSLDNPRSIIKPADHLSRPPARAPPAA